MKPLTKKAEELLKEILEHRLDNGNCNTQYWIERFNSLSVAEDVILRSLFKELREAEMISMSWADNCPYNLHLLGNGISYFDELLKIENNAKINLSVNNVFGSANEIQIQQGTNNSMQKQLMLVPLDNSKINELIKTIRRYESILNDEYGNDNAKELRRLVNELESLTNKSNSEQKKRNLIMAIRDLSINAGGGLVTSGILHLISTLLG